ncbi:hypothetical protein UPYG_G00349230 [Umbra pygmaea]|uniref:Uncharacterized protein n=1 Tax=Umbra pygmaea TaxID=75934 RepID=A0ABD0W2K0_UMBPY
MTNCGLYRPLTSMATHYWLITETIMYTMGCLGEQLWFLLAVWLFRVDCFPVDESQKQDAMSLQRFQDLSTIDSIHRLLSLLQSVRSVSNAEAVDLYIKELQSQSNYSATDI